MYLVLMVAICHCERSEVICVICIGGLVIANAVKQSV